MSGKMFGVRLLNRLLAVNLPNRSVSFRYTSTKSKSENIISEDEPIKYSSSAASKHRAETSRTGIEEPRLWYEPIVILSSVAVFLIYFTILRGENDIDEELGRSLYSRIAGLEEHQLKLSLQYNLERGLDTEAIRKRLKEIEEEKSRVENE